MVNLIDLNTLWTKPMKFANLSSIILWLLAGKMKEICPQHENEYLCLCNLQVSYYFPA